MDGGRLQPSVGHDNKCYGATASEDSTPPHVAPLQLPSINTPHTPQQPPQPQQQETSFSTTPQISLCQGRQNEGATFENSYANQYGAMEGRDEASAKTTEGVVPEQMECCEGGDEEEDEGTSEPCGWGPIRLSCCNALRSPKVVLLCLCFASALQGMVVNGFVSVVISSIERRFEMASSETGFIASAYDVASVLCLIPVSYLGGLGHKPRWLGTGVLILGLGSLLFALPHFTSHLYSYDPARQTGLCVDPNSGFGNETEAECSQKGGSPSGLSKYKYMFIFAQLFHGMGATPLFTLGVAYLDENLTPKETPVYTGVFYAMAIIGPALGYVIGGEMLNFYTDIDSIDVSQVTLKPEDPQWVGAWWLGFLLVGMLAIFIAVPILGFPRRLPGSAKRRAGLVSEAYGGTDPGFTGGGRGGALKNIPAALKVLLTNPTFMFLNLAGASEGLLISGFTVFTPKFVESQFSISAGWAAQVVGFVTIPAGGGGTFIGGYLVKRFDLKCAAILKMCLVTSFTALVLTLSFLVRCSNATFAGLNVDYSNYSMSLDNVNLSSECNVHCECKQDRFEPVCGANNIIYFSPCYAACPTPVTDNGEGQKVYENCSCVAGPYSPADSAPFTLDPNMAVDGKCNTGCQLLGVFLFIFALIISFTFATSMPALSATLRCVPEKQKSFALGIQWIIARCLGTIPAPIVFGSMIDKTCLLWQDVCGEQGSCFVYDNRAMGTYLLALAICCKTLSVSFLALALGLYRPPPPRKGQDLHSEDPTDVGNLVSGGHTLQVVGSKTSHEGSMADGSVNSASFLLTPDSKMSSPNPACCSGNRPPRLHTQHQ